LGFETAELISSGCLPDGAWPQRPFLAVSEHRIGRYAVEKLDPMTDDADLEERFDRLFRTHYGPLVILFGRRGLDSGISQDLAQETLLRAFRGLANFESRADLGTWVRRIALNVWRNWLRDERGTAKRPGGERSLEELGHGDLQVSNDEGLWPRQWGDPERHLAEKQIRELLAAAILALPSREKTCVRLWLEGWTYQEIANREAISIQTVRASLSRAKSKLQQRSRASEG